MLAFGQFQMSDVHFVCAFVFFSSFRSCFAAMQQNTRGQNGQPICKICNKLWEQDEEIAVENRAQMKLS